MQREHNELADRLVNEALDARKAREAGLLVFAGPKYTVRAIGATRGDKMFGANNDRRAARGEQVPGRLESLSGSQSQWRFLQHQSRRRAPRRSTLTTRKASGQRRRSRRPNPGRRLPSLLCGPGTSRWMCPFRPVLARAPVSGHLPRTIPCSSPCPRRMGSSRSSPSTSRRSWRPGLARRHPEIKTYNGRGVTDRAATIHAD